MNQEKLCEFCEAKISNSGYHHRKRYCLNCSILVKWHRDRIRHFENALENAKKDFVKASEKAKKERLKKENAS